MLRLLPPSLGRALGALAFLAASSAGARAAQAAQAAPPDPAATATLEAVAHTLAKSARVEDVREIVAILTGLGHDPEKLAKLTKTCEAELAKAKPAATAPKEAGRKLRAAAATLAAALATTEADKQPQLARLLLRLDDSLEPARLAAGHERDGAGWITPDEMVCRVRRGEIATKLQEARKLAVQVEVGESTHPLLVELYGGPGVVAKAGGIALHLPTGAEKAERMVREALRASALSTWLRSGGALTVAKRTLGQTLILADTKARYEQAIALSLRDGHLDAKGAEEARLLASYNEKRGFVLHSVLEGDTLAVMLRSHSTLADGAQTALTAGHLNWLSMAYFGSRLPNYSWKEKGGSVPSPYGNTKVADTAELKKEREERLRLSAGGIAGCRSYMTWLVERGEDPPWSRAMVDQLGKIEGEDLLKTTSIVEFLQELGPLAPLFKATNVEIKGPPEAVYVKALGQNLGTFEARWRAWLIPARPGLVQRLEAAATKPTAAARADAVVEQTILRELNRLRAACIPEELEVPPLTLEDSLSDGARLHALYLEKNPEQAVAWPDAHEEYADREGFTPEGAWAGAHSDVFAGIRSPEAALEGWMGTFYHRLPLIDPGLMRIGWGFEEGFAVIDVGSLSAPPDRAWKVAWPYDGMSGVPTTFSGPELPSPVPDADQSEWGYPITLQVGIPPEDEAGPVVMRLLQGKDEVECHYSTPENPTNPVSAPKGAYCLIPKRHLLEGKPYTVQVEWPASGKKWSWSFRT